MPSPFTPPGEFPKQLVIMVTEAVNETIIDAAKVNRLSKSEVARTLIDAGLKVGDLAAEYGVPIDVILAHARNGLELELAASQATTIEAPATRSVPIE